METAEEVLFRYAYPCREHMHDNKQISTPNYHRLQECYEKRIIPTKEELTQMFPDAVKHIKEWTPNGVRTYFIEEHNKIVAEKNLPLSCRVEVGIITKICTSDNNKIYWIDTSNGQLGILGLYLPNVKKGDKISAHWKCAIEKL